MPENEVNELAQMYLDKAFELMEMEGYFPARIVYETEDGDLVKYECLDDGR